MQIKKPMIAAMLLGAALSSCNESSTPPPLATAQEAFQEVFSPAHPKPLQLVVFVVPVGNGAKVSGETNLPTGTQLMLSIRRGSVGTGDKVSIAEGRFSMELYPERGAKIPPGDYEVGVSSPLGALQPDDVKAQLGSDYEALTGPLLKVGSFGARLIEYTTKVQLGGPANPEADRAARKQGYREHEEFSRRSCESNPDTVETLTGRQMSAERRAASVANCLREMEASRRELVAEGLIEP